jgi:hypothetical protein
MPTDVICGRCRQHYDSDLQVQVCPHELIEDVERFRKAGDKNTCNSEGSKHANEYGLRHVSTPQKRLILHGAGHLCSNRTSGAALRVFRCGSK